MSRFGSTFNLYSSDVDKIVKSIQGFSGNAEREINDYLKTVGNKKLVDSITYVTPVSAQRKKHAKDSKPYKTQNYNLSVVIKPKSSFYYLGFVDEGSGTSSKYQAHIGFMSRGVESTSDEIVNNLLDRLSRRMEDI
ncbi:MAG: hypothetical protein DBY41_08545 [Clostridium sp.]|uniref:hypothetical protein n=1 Tax=Intestinibacter bartlettii TaxID=261299 RepID=UPI000D7A8328|nr:hypothetical protein [Intestinibacter bartlettii]MDU2692797.1 hypothetical protein [Intestinibacter bartlettii]PWM78470.1 MAG: hypothetical protein DBY41_08545 [Clostridium sp.]